MLYYYFKGCGLATININDKLLFVGSKCGILYNVTLIIALLIMYYAIFIKSFARFPAVIRVRFDRIIDIVHTSLAAISASFILIVHCVQQKKISTLANEILAIGNAFPISNQHYSSLDKKTKAIFLANCFTWILILVTTDVTSWGNFIYFTCLYMCNFVITFTLIQYSMILKIIQYFFKSLNLRLSNTSIYSFKIEQFSKLRESYFALSDISEELSKFYSLPTMFCLSYIFVTLIFFAHLITKPVLLWSGEISNFQICHCIFRIFHYFVSLAILTSSVSDAVSEVRWKSLKHFHC